LELELDFSEEEVEFADRRHLMELCTKAHDTITKLAKSFKAGKMYKDGIPAVIAGKPNAGKSTLLNRLSEDDLAIVSDIPGTTRDVIEARIEIGGTLFRFYDTAGLRAEADEIEAQGIERARRKISQCSLLLWMVDATTLSDDESLDEALPFGPNGECDTLSEECSIYILLNKIDLIDQQSANRIMESCSKLAEKEDRRIVLLPISASEGKGIAELERRIETEFCLRHNEEAAMTVSNVRHYESLVKAERAISRAAEGIEAGISADFIAQDVRETTDALSSITGTISAPDLLQTIFSRFCIGK
ncbi:MAG: 50S ribosome-binding GTPase, partial [Muribaculaceae bacterium]|nr:50S ribosome-binding GTPase [Muribaculaceae bacterium]